MTILRCVPALAIEICSLRPGLESSGQTRNFRQYSRSWFHHKNSWHAYCNRSGLSRVYADIRELSDNLGGKRLKRRVARDYSACRTLGDPPRQASTMLISNPFAELSASVPPSVMQAYVVVMAFLVAAGTLFDIIHKKSATYFFNSWRNSTNKAKQQVGGGEMLA